MIVVVMLVIGVPLFLAFLPLFITSAQYRKMIDQYMRWIMPGLAVGLIASCLVRDRRLSAENAQTSRTKSP